MLKTKHWYKAHISSAAMKFPQHVHSVTPGDGYPPLIRQADFSNVWWSQICWLNTHGQYHLVMKYFLVS